MEIVSQKEVIRENLVRDISFRPPNSEPSLRPCMYIDGQI